MTEYRYIKNLLIIGIALLMIGCISQKKEMTEEEYLKYKNDICTKWKQPVIQLQGETLTIRGQHLVTYGNIPKFIQDAKEEHEKASRIRPPSKYEECHQNLIKFPDVLISMEPRQDITTKIHGTQAALFYVSYCDRCYQNNIINLVAYT